MRFLTRAAVCLACVLMATRGAEAGPIQVSDLVLHSYVDISERWSSPVRDDDAHLGWFRDEVNWRSQYSLTPGKAPLVDWIDRGAFMRAVGEASIAWKWSAPRQEKDAPSGVPEPATLLLFGLGAIAFARVTSRRTGIGAR